MWQGARVSGEPARAGSCRAMDIRCHREKVEILVLYWA